MTPTISAPAPAPGFTAAPAAPARPPYACWCLLPGDQHFVYLYGPTAECERVVRTLSPWVCQHQGDRGTLAEVRDRAERAAANVGRFGGHGVARVVAAEVYRQWHETEDAPPLAVARAA